MCVGGEALVNSYFAKFTLKWNVSDIFIYFLLLIRIKHINSYNQTPLIRSNTTQLNLVYQCHHNIGM